MYKNILVAIDESHTSDLALKEAVKYAKEHPDSILRIVHVVDEFNIYFDSTEFTPVELEQAIKRAGVKLLKKIESKLQKQQVSNFETKLLEIKKVGGHIYHEIADEAKEWPADLIIVGTHGRRGFSHFFLGSVAEGVSRIAPVPVLLIRLKPTTEKSNK